MYRNTAHRYESFSLLLNLGNDSYICSTIVNVLIALHAFYGWEKYAKSVANIYCTQQ